jgi:hypothetical protein
MLKIHGFVILYCKVPITLEVHLRIFKADLRGYIMLQAASQSRTQVQETFKILWARIRIRREEISEKF